MLCTVLEYVRLWSYNIKKKCCQLKILISWKHLSHKERKIFQDSYLNWAGLLMGDDIGSGLSSMSVCFDFRSTNIVQLSNWNPYFYRFRCHHPLLTQLSLSFSVLKSYLTAAFRDQVSIGNSSFWYKLDRVLIGSLIKSSYKSFVNL